MAERNRPKHAARTAFLQRMGWKLRGVSGSANLSEVVGADEKVLFERNTGQVHAYLDGLMDGLAGTPFEHSKRHDEIVGGQT